MVRLIFIASSLFVHLCLAGFACFKAFLVLVGGSLTQLFMLYITETLDALTYNTNS